MYMLPDLKTVVIYIFNTLFMVINSYINRPMVHVCNTAKVEESANARASFPSLQYVMYVCAQVVFKWLHLTLDK